jgi:tRNA 2-selenouridine synthase
MRDNTADYRAIFLHDVPMMDVRAPVEFAKGAFPGVVNLPLMNDAERQAVGTCYKQQGQQAAIELGHRLVSGDIKAERIAAWGRFAQAHPDGLLYCFRGGLRSQIVQQWLQSEAGICYPRVIGGYKALRSFLLESLQHDVEQSRFVVLGGLTGAGKTELLHQLPNSLDLEGHANHRGSGFGSRPTGQPVQIDFENTLAIDLLKKRARGHACFVLEDEGKHIGRCAVPLVLRQIMAKAPVVWVEVPFEARVARIERDYVVAQHADFVAVFGDAQGDAAFRAHLLGSLAKIAQRLGGERYQRLQGIMAAALATPGVGDLALHREWIAALLSSYYDPMYAYQRHQKADRITFVGDAAEVLGYLRATG